jgi:hypothetical protein
MQPANRIRTTMMTIKRDRIDGCCIYGLHDSRSPWRIQYVGATINVMARWSAYLGYWDKRYCHSTALTQWFASLRKAGAMPQLEVLEYCTEPELHELEQAWITHLNRFFPLHNDRRASRYRAKVSEKYSTD